MDSRMCSAQKCTFWQRGAEPTTCNFARALSVSFERPWSPTWTSPQLTTSAFLESSSLCRALCECHNNGWCRHERRHPFLELVPRSAHLPSQWHTSSKSMERELRPHCRFLLPVTHALGDEIAEASFGRLAEPNTRIKNRYRYSCRCWSWTLKKGISPCSGFVAWKQKCCLSLSSSEAVQL